MHRRVPLQNQNGLSLVEVAIVSSVFLISTIAMMTFFNQQQTAVNALEFQGKRQQISMALAGQFLTDTINCKCLFAGSNPFPITGTPELTGVTPVAVGRFDYSNPNSCAGATIPAPIVSTTESEGIVARYIGIKNIVKTGSRHKGDFVVQVESTKPVIGSKLLYVKIPVHVNVTPASGSTVTFESCALADELMTPTAGILLDPPLNLVVCVNNQVAPFFSNMCSPSPTSNPSVQPWLGTIEAGVTSRIPGGAKEVLLFASIDDAHEPAIVVQYKWPANTAWLDLLEAQKTAQFPSSNSVWVPLDVNGRLQWRVYKPDGGHVITEQSYRVQIQGYR